MRYCIALTFFLFSLSHLFAQDLLSDTVLYRRALNQTLTYNHSLATRTYGLYTGILYVRDYYNVKGDPFFQVDSFQKGEVFYNGMLYKNIDLLYDLSHDNVIVKYSGDVNLVLVPEKTGYFNLPGHLFIKGSDASPAKQGFYDLLFDGKIKVVVKRSKEQVPWSKSFEFNSVFIQHNDYFIYKDGNYKAAKNKKELLDVLEDKKADLKDFISKNKLDFRKDFEKALVQTATYYDQVTQ
jgi:hypothetical protein